LGIAVLHYVNIAAAKLFESVEVFNLYASRWPQNVIDLRVASIVFWAAYFVNCRGATETQIKALFEQLATSATFLASYNDGLREFKTIHDRLFDFFLTRLNTYVNEWRESDAGKAFEGYIVHARYFPLDSSTR
jgi:hypothetical protein